VTSIIAIVYLSTNSPKLEVTTVLWKTDLEHFAWDITVADGRIFTSNNEATFCYNYTNGKSLWNTSLLRNRGIEFYQDNVYTGSMGGIVNKLDEETGELLAQFSAPVSSSIGSKTPPDFFLADNKIFVQSDGVAVYDVETEQLLWKNNVMADLTLGNTSLSTSESNYVFIRGNTRYNPNNGSVLWSIQGRQSPHLVIDQKQVVFWNYYPTFSDFGQVIHSVNATTGDTLWSYDVGTSVFKPTSYTDLLLFGSVKGYFYALNITDGSLVWREHVDTNDLLLNYNLASVDSDSLKASHVYLDLEDERVYWGFILEQEDKASGDLVCLDISTGNIIWTNQFSTEGSIAKESLPDLVGLVSLKNTFFFTAKNHLWIFNKVSESLVDVKIFDHYVLPPVLEENRVLIAADLFLFAYE
jgi:outer membrane protein assembly factor BamB